MNDKEAKDMHLRDANKALKALQSDKTVDPIQKQFRSECLNEFITMIETGKTDHINLHVDESDKHEHFK